MRRSSALGVLSFVFLWMIRLLVLVLVVADFSDGISVVTSASLHGSVPLCFVASLRANLSISEI